jgi:hypothetical protein
VDRAQNFSTRLVAAGVAEGWLTIQGNQVILTAKPERLVYRILRVPGRHANPAVPGGMEVLNHYECELNAAQHEAYRADEKGDARG